MYITWHSFFKWLLQAPPQTPALTSYRWSIFFPATMAACLDLWFWILRASDNLTAAKEPNSHEGRRDHGFNWNRSRIAFARPRPTWASQEKTHRESVYDLNKDMTVIYYGIEKHVWYLSTQTYNSGLLLPHIYPVVPHSHGKNSGKFICSGLLSGNNKLESTTTRTNHY